MGGGTGLRTKFLRTEVLSRLVLRTSLRNSESEPVLAAPPAVRIVPAGGQPATSAATVRAEEARAAVRIADRLVHGNDTDQTHGLDLLIRELLADKAGHLRFRLAELALLGLRANLPRDPVVVLEERAFQDGHFGRHTTRRPEVRRTEQLLGVFNAETLRFQTLDPVLAGRSVARDREVDDAVFLAPRTGR